MFGGGTPLPPPAFYFTSIDIENSFSEPQPPKGSRSILLKVIFFKFLILFRGLPRRRSPAEIAARWRYRLPITNMTAHYDGQFCESFNFCFYQEAQKCL